jgi:hypothetical protein
MRALALRCIRLRISRRSRNSTGFGAGLLVNRKRPFEKSCHMAVCGRIEPDDRLSSTLSALWSQPDRDGSFQGAERTFEVPPGSTIAATG